MRAEQCELDVRRGGPAVSLAFTAATRRERSPGWRTDGTDESPAAVEKTDAVGAATASPPSSPRGEKARARHDINIEDSGSIKRRKNSRRVEMTGSKTLDPVQEPM